MKLLPSGCKYITLVDIQKHPLKLILSKGESHVESHESTWSLLESGEQCYIKAIIITFQGSHSLQKFAFFRCCMHFSHITAKWLNTNWTSCGSLWLPRHSTLDLLAKSVSSKTVQLHSWWSSLSSQPWPNAPLCHALKVQSMKGRIWTMTK